MKHMTKGELAKQRQHLEELVKERTVQVEAANQQLTASNQQLRATEEVLRESEKKYRTLFETMSEGIVYEDHDGKIISANPAAERLLGLSLDQMQGRTSIDPRWKAIHEDGSPFPGETHSLRVAAMTGKAATGEVQGIYNPKSGAYIWLSINSTPEFLPGETTPFRAYAVFRDITERKKADEQIRFQADIIENSPVIAAYHDRDLNVVWVNRAYQKATGLSLEEVRGRKCYQVWKLSGPCRGCPVITAIETGESAAAELTPDNQDNWPETQGCWLSQASPVRDEQGTVIGALEFAIDLTERKRAERELQAANQQLHSANQQLRATEQQLRAGNQQLRATEQQLRASNLQLEAGLNRLAEAQAIGRLGSWEWDTVKDVISGSDEFYRLFGVGHDQLRTYQAFVDLLHLDDREHVNRDVKESVAKKALYDTQYRVRMRNGDYRHIHARGQILTDDAGKPVRMVGTCLDITERKRMEGELGKYRDELEQRVQDRTAELEAVNHELEAFSYSVSHDLKAPLRSVDGFAQMLEEDYADRLDDEGRRLLKVVRDSARDMGQLVNDLLTFSRLSRKDLTVARLDLRRMAEDALRQMEPDAAGRTIRWEIGELPPANGDEATIREVLVNLFTNAVKFTRPRAEAVISFAGHVEAGELVYAVTDNGVGFDMTYKDKLFGVFQRLHTSDEFEGTGIGLALVQRIIQRHGGRVWAEGEHDKGARFCFTLPCEGTSAEVGTRNGEA